MNGIHLYWTMNTLKTMGSVIRPLIPIKTFSLITILMNLVIMSIDHCTLFHISDDSPPISPIHKLIVNKHVYQSIPVDYEKLRPFFGGVNSDIVKRTIDQTTQWD